MESFVSKGIEKKQDDTAKREWVRPEVTGIEAGSAESSRAGMGDAGGGFQQS